MFPFDKVLHSASRKLFVSIRSLIFQEGVGRLDRLDVDTCSQLVTCCSRHTVTHSHCCHLWRRVKCPRAESAMAGSSWGVQTWCDLLYNPVGLSSPHWNEVLSPSASERFISFPSRASLKQRCQFWKRRFTMLGDEFCDLRSGFCTSVSSFWSVFSKESLLKWHILVS